jgi:hypothetical protein
MLALENAVVYTDLLHLYHHNHNYPSKLVYKVLAIGFMPFKRLPLEFIGKLYPRIKRACLLVMSLLFADTQRCKHSKPSVCAAWFCSC